MKEFRKMITHVTQSEFIDTFRNSPTYKNNFSYDGLIALFEYFEDLEESTGENINFDMVSICCDYTEYKNIEEYITDYQDQIHNLRDLLDLDYSEIISVLRDHTEVIEFKGRTTEAFIGNISTPDKSFIIRAF